MHTTIKSSPTHPHVQSTSEQYHRKRKKYLAAWATGKGNTKHAMFSQR